MLQFSDCSYCGQISAAVEFMCSSVGKLGCLAPGAICHMKASVSHANNMWVPGGCIPLELQRFAGTAP